jgi:integrase
MGRLTVAGAVQHYLNKTKAIGKPIMEFHARHITAALGEVPAEAVDQDAVDRYIKGRSAAPGTVRKELGILRAALRFCAKAKVMGPAPQFSLPTAPAPRDRRLTRAEFDRLLAACKDHHLAVFCQLAWHTAARASAILDLKWSDVDLKGRRIHYTAAGRQKRRVTVPINDTLLPVLQEALKGALTPFVVEYAGKPVGSIKKAFATACGHAGLVDVSPHVLRHSAACAMIEKGVSFEEVAQFLGHSSPSVTFRVYARYSPEYLANAAKALER